MKKVSFIALVLLSTTLAVAARPHKHISHKVHKKIRIAVIDTGLNLDDPRFKGHLCSTGHTNFVPGETINDINDHGTFVAGLIQQYAGQSDYCMIIYKYYTEKATGPQNLNRENRALQESVRNHVDIVNFSGGGPEGDNEEFALIRDNPGITFVVAAGNENSNLDEADNEFYPASYWLKNEKVIAARGTDGLRLKSSNWGSKVEWEPGEHVKSYLPNGTEGYMSGSSMATAIYSGKLVDKLSKTCEAK